MGMSLISVLLAAQAVTTPPVSTSDSLGVATSSRNATPAVAGPTNKLVCRSQLEIGSLVNRKRECHSQSVWDQMASDSRNNLNANTISGNHGRTGGGG